MRAFVLGLVLCALATRASADEVAGPAPCVGAWNLKLARLGDPSPLYLDAEIAFLLVPGPQGAIEARSRFGKKSLALVSARTDGDGCRVELALSTGDPAFGDHARGKLHLSAKGATVTGDGLELDDGPPSATTKVTVTGTRRDLTPSDTVLDERAAATILAQLVSACATLPPGVLVEVVAEVDRDGLVQAVTLNRVRHDAHDAAFFADTDARATHGQIYNPTGAPQKVAFAMMADVVPDWGKLSLPELVEKTKLPAWGVRLAAIAEMAHRPVDAAILDTLEHLAHDDPAAEVRLAALQALGPKTAAGASARWQTLRLDALHDADAKVRAEAADQLTPAGPETAATLLAAFQTETVPDVKRSLYQALRPASPPGFADALVAAAAKDCEWAEALAAIKDPRALPLLIDWTKRGCTDQSMTQALAGTQDPRAIDPLISVLASKTRDDVVFAVVAMADFPDPRFVPPLLALWSGLSDDDQRAEGEGEGDEPLGNFVAITLRAIGEHDPAPCDAAQTASPAVAAYLHAILPATGCGGVRKPSPIVKVSIALVHKPWGNLVAEYQDGHKQTLTHDGLALDPKLAEDHRTIGYTIGKTGRRGTEEFALAVMRDGAPLTTIDYTAGDRGGWAFRAGGEQIATCWGVERGPLHCSLWDAATGKELETAESDEDQADWADGFE